jgi:hypothetical protein
VHRSPRHPVESSEAATLVAAMLVRVPEIASVRYLPRTGVVAVSYALAEKLDAAAIKALASALNLHVRAYFDLIDEGPPKTIRVKAETGDAMTFVHVERDAATFSKDELLLQIAILADRFGATLVRDTPADVHDAELADRDEAIEAALLSIRDPALHKSVVGYREEHRVLVYFVHTTRKVAARS